MASYTLAVPLWTDGNPTFQDGSVLAATPIDGSIDDAVTATVSFGVASFTGLLPLKQYVARAPVNGDVREVRFTSSSETNVDNVDATSTVKGVLQISGDLTGTAGAPKVRPALLGPTVNLAAMASWIGDGTSDEIAAVNEAAAILNNAGGGTLVCPASKFTVNSPVTFTGSTLIRGASRSTSWWVTTQPIEQVIFTASFCAVQDIRISNDTVAGVLAGCAVVVRGGVESLSVHRAVLRGYDGLVIESAFQCTVDDSRFTSCLRYGIRVENRYRPDSGDHKFNNLNIAGDSVSINTTGTGAGSQNVLAVADQSRIVPGLTLTVGSDVYTVASVSGTNVTMTQNLASSYSGASVKAQSGVAGIGYFSGGGLKLSNSKIVRYQRHILHRIGTYQSTVAAGTGTQNQSGQAVVALNNVDGAVSGQTLIVDVAGVTESKAISTSTRNTDGSGTVTLTTNLANTHSVGATCYVGVSTSPFNIVGNSFENPQEESILMDRGTAGYGTWHSGVIASNEFALSTARAGVSGIRIEDGFYDITIPPNVAYGRQAKDQAFIEINSSSGHVSVGRQKVKTFDCAVKIGSGAQPHISDQDITSTFAPIRDTRTVGSMVTPVVHRVFKWQNQSSADTWYTLADVDMSATAYLGAVLKVRLHGTVNSGVSGFSLSAEYALVKGGTGGSVAKTLVAGSETVANSNVTGGGVGLLNFQVDTSSSAGHALVQVRRPAAATGSSFTAAAYVEVVGQVASVT